MELLIGVLGALLAGVLLISFWVQKRLAKGGQVSFLDTGPDRPTRNAGVLWSLVLAAAIYGVAFRSLPTLTGRLMLDGGISVAFGLFICAHPAANWVNMLFFERHALRRISSEWSVVRWLALNLLVLLAGWMVVYLGLTRLVGRST